MNLDYLKKYPLSTHGGKTLRTRVIHEGLTNRPDLKQKLDKLIADLTNVSQNENSHLSDIAWRINYAGQQLIELAKETFEAHNVEKTLDVKQADMQNNIVLPEPDWSNVYFNHINKVNAVIRRKFPNIYLAKGEDYYYLYSDDEATGKKISGLYQSGIYVAKAKHLTVQQWIDAVGELVKKFKD